MDSILIGPDGGTILKFEPTLQEPVSGPARAGQAFLYYLRGVGFRIKFFGSDGEPITEANVSVIFETQTVAPDPVPGKAQVYILDVNNISQLFYQDTEGTSSQLTPTPDLTLFLKKDGSVALTGNISAGTHKVTSLGTGTAPGDAVNKGQMDAADAASVVASEAYTDSSVSAEAVTRAAAVSAEASARSSADTTLQNNINAEAASRSSGDSAAVATAEGYADTLEALDIRKDGSRAFTGDQSMGSHKLTNVTDPGSNQDAATKKYVDDNAGGSPAYVLGSPGDLTLTDNDLFLVLNGQGADIDLLTANVRTAPTGADVIVEFLLITLATMSLDSSLGTVTIAAGTKTGSTGISLTNIPTTKGVTMQINQIGSTIPGATLTGIAKKS